MELFNVRTYGGQDGRTKLARAAGNNRLLKGMVYRLILAVHWIVISGCIMSEQIILDMDQAYAVRESNEDVSRVVQKRFPRGMEIGEAQTLLRDLIRAGFQINEYRHDGARQWPDGEMRPYHDEATKAQLQKRYQKSTIEYVAENRYDRKYVVVTKTAVIILRTDGKIVTESSGRINISGI